MRQVIDRGIPAWIAPEFNSYPDGLSCIKSITPSYWIDRPRLQLGTAFSKHLSLAFFQFKDPYLFEELSEKLGCAGRFLPEQPNFRFFLPPPFLGAGVSPAGVKRRWVGVIIQGFALALRKPVHLGGREQGQEGARPESLSRRAWLDHSPANRGGCGKAGYRFRGRELKDLVRPY
jgi:hypothetical protein